MKMIVWKAPPILAPLLRRIFGAQEKKQRVDH